MCGINSHRRLSYVEVCWIKKPIVGVPIDVAQSEIVSGLYFPGGRIGVPRATLVRKHELELEEVPIDRVQFALVEPGRGYHIAIIDRDRILPVSPPVDFCRVIYGATLPQQRMGVRRFVLTAGTGQTRYEQRWS